MERQLKLSKLDEVSCSKLCWRGRKLVFVASAVLKCWAYLIMLLNTPFILVEYFGVVPTTVVVLTNLRSTTLFLDKYMISLQIPTGQLLEPLEGPSFFLYTCKLKYLRNSTALFKTLLSGCFWLFK